MPASAPPRWRRAAVLWGPVLGYVLAIFVLSSFPQPSEAQIFTYEDKVLHLIEYGVLGLLLARATLLGAPAARRAAAALAWLAGIMVAAADEAYQSATPGRSSSLADLTVDAFALALAVTVTLVLHRARRRDRA